jgi:hypothetical protein
VPILPGGKYQSCGAIKLAGWNQLYDNGPTARIAAMLSAVARGLTATKKAPAPSALQKFGSAPPRYVFCTISQKIIDLKIVLCELVQKSPRTKQPRS